MTTNKGQDKETLSSQVLEDLDKEYRDKKDAIINSVLLLLDGLNYLQIENILDNIKSSAKYFPVKIHLHS